MRAISPLICTRCADGAGGERPGRGDGRRPRALAAVAAVAAVAAALPASAIAHAPAGWPETGAQAAPWSLEPWVAVPLLWSALLYGMGFVALWRASRLGRNLRLAQAIAFACGWLQLVVALLSPIDALAERLFWVHMVQHEILMLAAAPLLVLGRPLPVFLWALPAPLRRRVARPATRWLRRPWRALSSPACAFSVQAAVLWGWHAPAAFSAGLRNADIHTLQHASFLFAATLFWWSLLAARRDRRRDALAALWLFATMLHTGLLGALLTFAPTVWYAPYLATAPAHGFAPLADQQLGGLIMWVPGGMAYLAAGLWRAAGMLQPRLAEPRLSG